MSRNVEESGSHEIVKRIVFHEKMDRNSKECGSHEIVERNSFYKQMDINAPIENKNSIDI